MGYVCDLYCKFRLTVTVKWKKLFDRNERAIPTRYEDKTNYRLARERKSPGVGVGRGGGVGGWGT